MSKKNNKQTSLSISWMTGHFEPGGLTLPVKISRRILNDYWYATDSELKNIPIEELEKMARNTIDDLLIKINSDPQLEAICLNIYMEDFPDKDMSEISFDIFPYHLRIRNYVIFLNKHLEIPFDLKVIYALTSLRSAANNNENEALNFALLAMIYSRDDLLSYAETGKLHMDKMNSMRKSSKKKRKQTSEDNKKNCINAAMKKWPNVATWTRGDMADWIFEKKITGWKKSYISVCLKGIKNKALTKERF